jgi:GNAT superfamily N-acetyltransferase
VAYAKSKAAAMYAKLEAKYGSKWAKAIVATAVLTLPTPVTTLSVLAMTGLAHLCTGKKREEPFNEAEHYGYDPGEKRDEGGKWTANGGSGEPIPQRLQGKLQRLENRALREDFRPGNAALPDETRQYLGKKNQAAAAELYQMSAYHDVNRGLWSGKGLHPEDQWVSDNLQAACLAAPVLDQPVTVHRGPSLTRPEREAAIEHLKGLQESGQPYEHKGFLSTSTGGIASGEESDYNRPLQFVIQARQGLDLSPVADEDHVHEREMVLPAGSKFKVSKVETVGKKTFVHMEQVVDKDRGAAEHYSRGAELFAEIFAPTVRAVRQRGSSTPGAAALARALLDLLEHYPDLRALVSGSDLALLRSAAEHGGSGGATAPRPRHYGYDPNEARDASGEWTEGGGGTATAAQPSALTPSVPAQPKKFGKSKAAVKVPVFVDAAEMEARMKKVFGKKAPPVEDLASAVGAPDNASLRVEPVQHDGKPAVQIEIEHPAFTAKRIIFKNAAGVHILNDEFFMKESAQGQGIGSDVFGRQVEQCREMGIASIRCHAAKANPREPEKPHNGYYTWARLGYDADIEDDNFDTPVFKAIQAKFPEANTLQDVMASKEGRDWWKANGSDIYHARFELADGSRSMRIHDAYQAERAAKKAG